MVENSILKENTDEIEKDARSSRDNDECSSSFSGLWKDREKSRCSYNIFHTYMPSIHQHWTIALLVKVQHRTSFANLVDGSLGNDKYGNLIPSLAEDWSVSQDGLTYTYKTT